MEVQLGSAYWKVKRFINGNAKTEMGLLMKNLITAVLVSAAIGVVPLLAQEKNDMPMKEGMPMKAEAMKGGGMMMGKMKEMQGKMAEMQKGMGGMMKGQGMMKGEETNEMAKMMGGMSGMMGDMGGMMGGGKMAPEEMENMSKMMGDMSGMMKQMSDRMGRGMKISK